jgi:NADH-ubiquinone oxidoreductase chain 3
MNTTLIILLIFVPILALILLGLNTLLAPKRSYESKLSSYECGMPVLQTQTRESFQIHFVVVAMLFLIFDLELVLLLPLGVTLSKISTFGFAVAVLFFLILTVGFILEIGSKAISISPQLPQNETITSPSIQECQQTCLHLM